MIATTINTPITTNEMSTAMAKTPSVADTPASSFSSRKNSENTASMMASGTIHFSSDVENAIYKW